MFQCFLQSNRQTNIEWLRIISMLMIVAGHSIVHGGYSDFPLTANGLFAIALTQGSRIGVDIFVFLSGYFSVGRDIVSKKIKRQYLQIWTYSVIVTGLIILGKISAGIKIIAGALMPVATSQYWFATCYILLLCASPYLRMCMEKMTKKQYQKLLIIFGQ